MGPKIDLIRCGARVVGWANRKIQPDDPTLSFFSVVKKALHGTKARDFRPQPLRQWAQDHNDWIEKEASGSLLFYSSGSDSALGRRASIIMVCKAKAREPCLRVAGLRRLPACYLDDPSSLDFLLDTQAVAVVSCRADFVDTGGVLSSAYLYLTESTSSIRQLDSWITAEVFASSEPRLASQLFWKTLVTAGEVPSPRSSKIDMPIRP